MVNDGFVLIWHSTEHSKFPEEIGHDIQEALASSLLDESTEEGVGVGGVQECCACRKRKWSDVLNYQNYNRILMTQLSKHCM